jgi:hypothetical protein
LKPIGVTVITKSYRRVGRRAVSLFKRNTGLDVLVIKGEDSEGFELKLQLDKLCGRRPRVWFDADLFFIRGVDFHNMIPWSGFYGVHDSAVFNPRAFPWLDCKENGLDTSRYLNTGLFTCDLRNPETRKVFQEARKSWKLWKRGKLKTADTTDQYHLNLAMLKVPVTLLPTVFNFYQLACDWGQLPFIPREIIGLHGAGIPAKDKHWKLCEQMKVYGRPTCPMCDDAILNTHAKTYQLQ